MGLYSALAVFVGGGLGSLLRWWLSSELNPVFPTLPLGTLASNLVGGLLVGVCVAFFSNNTSLPPEARLLAITGFLGGLTTFSTFSAEVVTLITRTEYLWALAAASIHLLGSLAMTAVGMIAVNAAFAKT